MSWTATVLPASPQSWAAVRPVLPPPPLWGASEGSPARHVGGDELGFHCVAHTQVAVTQGGRCCSSHAPPPFQILPPPRPSGEYIAVERVEGVFQQCDAVEQLWVYGNSMESALVAVAVPSEAYARHWGEEHGATSTELKGLCGDAAFKQHVLELLSATGKAAKLHGFEDIKAVHLEAEQVRGGTGDAVVLDVSVFGSFVHREAEQVRGRVVEQCGGRGGSGTSDHAPPPLPAVALHPAPLPITARSSAPTTT